MTTTASQTNAIAFEEILKLFTTMDTPEKSAVLREQLSLFLKNKPLKERQFIGSILLSITKDNATQLLRSIKANKDMALLDLLEKEMAMFKNV